MLKSSGGATCERSATYERVCRRRGVPPAAAAAQACFSEDAPAPLPLTRRDRRADLPRARRTRLDGEAGVMLRAYRAHKVRLADMQLERDAARERLVTSRQWLTTRLASANAHALLQRCWLGWRLSVARVAQRLASASSAQGSTGVPIETPLPAAPSPPPAPLPPRLSRKDLYRMSYEALIDQVARAGSHS